MASAMPARKVTGPAAMPYARMASKSMAPTIAVSSPVTSSIPTPNTA